MDESYFSTLFLDLSEHLNTTVSELRWIDQDFDQLEEGDMRPAVSFPAVLLDVADAEFSDFAEGAQHGNVQVRIRLAFAPFSSTQHGAPATVKAKALIYYNIEQKIYKVMQGWRNNNTTSFTRRRVYTEKRDDRLRVRVLEFETSFEDVSGMRKRSTVPRPDLRVEGRTS